MGPKTSKTKRPASVNTEAITIPRVPQEIVDEILDHLAADPDRTPFQSCALVSKSWLPSCRRHLFHTVLFTSSNIHRWAIAFPVPESPGRHIRDLRFRVEGSSGIFNSEKFSEYIPWFTKVERMSLSRGGGHHLRGFPPSWRLPQSVTSLTIDADSSFLGDIWNIMVQLPNLNDLSLAGNIVTKDKSAVIGIGTALRGKFGGLLRLHGGVTFRDTVGMLLGTPTGLHFTEVEICAKYECLSTPRLAEACSNTLVKLTYTADLQYYRQETYERPLDFSKLPNLQEVYFGVAWMEGSLLWISTALSTIRTSTSSHLSVIKLSFARQLNASGPVQVAIKDPGIDLGKVADEVARIEREFKGTLSLTVFRDPEFEVVPDMLDINWH